jgi:hypothetical protein
LLLFCLDTNSGHVSEKTDAFAMGIIIIELLIGMGLRHENERTSDVTLQARAMVDTEGSEGLGKAAQAKVLEAGSCWAQGKGRQASKILIEVAASLVGPTGVRKTPAQVLGELEKAHKLAKDDNQGGGIFW